MQYSSWLNNLYRLFAQDIINGTTGYLHSGYEVRSTTEATFFAPIWENIAWHTLGPSVTGFDYNETTNILQVYVNQPGDGHISTMFM